MISLQLARRVPSPGGLRRLVLRNLTRCTPLTRAYPLRSRLWRLTGYEVSPSARCTASARFVVGHLTIKDRSFIGHEVRVIGSSSAEVVIEENVDLGPRVLVLAGTHRIGPASRRAGAGLGTRVRIGAGTWVGGGAVLVGPVDIGSGCVIAAGAVVRGDVENNTLYFSRDNRRPLPESLDEPEPSTSGLNLRRPERFPPLPTART